MKRQTGIDLVYEIMPKGWQEEARNLGALVRSRKIANAEELLMLNLIYQTSGGSFGLTALLTQISENHEDLNKTAVWKRITNSANWLQWLCEHLCLQEGFLAEPPEWLKDYRVCLVDASDYAIQGSRGTDFRLHCMMELFSLNAIEMHFTTVKEGETLTRYEKIQENDLVIADRGYGTITGMEYLRSHGAGYILRLKSNGFKLFDESGKEFDLTKELKNYSKNRILDYDLFYKIGKEMIPIRVCAVANTEEGIKKSQKQMKKGNKSGRELSSLQQIWSKYCVVATTLPREVTPEMVLSAYRMRWQIELVFKRFKSIFGGGEFTAKNEKSIRAWFYGKLLLAIICETLLRRGIFPPEQPEDSKH